MKHLICLGIVLLLAAPAAAQNDLFFEGGWDWLRTEYADGTFTSPTTEGYNVQLMFGPEGEFVRYVNETAIVNSTWYLAYVWIGFSHVGTLSTDAGDSWFPDHAYENYPDNLVLLLSDGIELPGGQGSPPTVTEVYLYRGPVNATRQTWGSLKSEFR